MKDMVVLIITDQDMIQISLVDIILKNIGLGMIDLALECMGKDMGSMMAMDKIITDLVLNKIVMVMGCKVCMDKK